MGTYITNKHFQCFNRNRLLALVLILFITVIICFILVFLRWGSLAFFFGSLYLDSSASYPVKNGLLFDDFHACLVKKRQDVNKTGTEEVNFLCTALCHQVNNILFVFLRTHERTKHLLEFRKLLLNDFKLLLGLHVLSHQVRDFCEHSW